VSFFKNLYKKLVDKVGIPLLLNTGIRGGNCLKRGCVVKLKAFFFISLVFITHTAWGEQAPWTWLYRYSPPTYAHRGFSRKRFVAARQDIAPFTQLIFSWNAHRPLKGKFVFWGQVRDAVTHKWYDWHRMADWGCDGQVTHCSVRKNSSSYNYVRLEAPEGRRGDGFRIKVEGTDGAVLQNFAQLNVCVSNLPAFTIEPMASLNSLPSVAIKDVPTYSQMEVASLDANRICSPTSLAMVLGYFNKEEYDPAVCAQNTYDPGLDTFGSWPFNVAHAYTACTTPRHFYVRRLPGFAQLHKFLMQGTPVIVSIRGQLKGMPEGLTYSQGHLLVVIGYDHKNKKVRCHDPAFAKGSMVSHSYDASDFIRAWERSRRLAYLSDAIS